MKFLLLLILYLAVCGCDSLVVNPNLNLKLNSTNSNSKVNVCPKQPIGTLSQADVKVIALTSAEITETGQIRAGQNLGYAFDAKAKQKLNFNTKENLCLYVYTPSNQLLNGSELAENGRHTIQVAVASGATTFNLAMKLTNSDISLNASQKGIVQQPINQQATTQMQTPIQLTVNNIRVNFSAGSIGTSIQGSIATSQINRYLLECGSSQVMSIRILEGNINLAVIDPEGRNLGTVKNDFWQGRLPMNGDYALEVSSQNGSDYKFNVEII